MIFCGSAPIPELQCFISDSQLTRDAALHLRPEDLVRVFADYIHHHLLFHLGLQYLWISQKVQFRLKNITRQLLDPPNSPPGVPKLWGKSHKKEKT